MYYDGSTGVVIAEGERDEFAELVRVLRAMPDDDVDKDTGDSLADEIQESCVDRDEGIFGFDPGDETDAMSAAMEQQKHPDAQSFIAAIASAEIDGDGDDD